MSKALAIGVAATACAATAGAVYYVGPSPAANLDTPPILVDGTPEQALARVRRITMANYLQHIGNSSRDAEIIHMVMVKTTPNEMVAKIDVDSDRVLVLHAKATPAESGKTALDITAELPDSRLARNPALHPYDLKVMAAIADFAATDYVSSILTGDRMASRDEMDRALVQRIGFDEAERTAFSERIGSALRETYGRKERSGSEWVQDAYDPTPSARIYEGSDPSEEAERAAEAARYAAESAAREAQEAAARAEREARGTGY